MFGERLKRYIALNYLGDENENIEDDTHLLDLNIIDSSELFDLVAYLKREVNCIVPINEITPDNFNTISSIKHLVDRLMKA